MSSTVTADPLDALFDALKSRDDTAYLRAFGATEGDATKYVDAAGDWTDAYRAIQSTATDPLRRGGPYNVVRLVSGNPDDVPGDNLVTWPVGYFQGADDILRLMVSTKDTDPATGKPLRVPVTIAGPFKVEGVLSGANGRRSISLSWLGDLNQHCTATPAVSDLANPRSSTIYNDLIGNGLVVEIGRERQLADGLRGVKHRLVARSVDTTGWHDLDEAAPVYMLPSGAVVGRPAGSVILANPCIRPGQFSAIGSLAAWNAAQGTYSAGNSRMVFAIAAALAGPALALTGEASGIFSFTGISGDGKSSCLRVAGSVWGGPGMVRNWKGTMAGLEALLAGSSDGPLLLDEMGQAKQTEIADIVYMIGNEAGSNRMTRGLSAAGLKTWRTVALSAGEETLEAVMRKIGQEFKGGMEVRMLNIPSDAGKGYRVYETLHDQPDDNALSVLLAQACAANGGHVGPAFLAAFVGAVQADRDGLVRAWSASREAFIAKAAGRDAAGPVKRAASRFALVAWVGEFAIAADALPWPAGHAEWAAATCFEAWVKARGHTGDSDTAAAVDRLRLFLSEHGPSRMPTVIEGTRQHFDRIQQHAGWRRDKLVGEGVSVRSDTPSRFNLVR